MQQIGQVQPIEISGEQIRPWIRYWARMIDIILFTIILSIIVLIVYPPLYEISNTIFGMITLFAYTFVEAAILSKWGKTPGKAFFKTQVHNKDHTKLSYNDALYRSWRVVYKGMGFGLPFISLLTLVYSFFSLKDEKITSWDQEGEFIVTHQSIGLPKVLIATIIFMFIIFIIVSKN